MKAILAQAVRDAARQALEGCLAQSGGHEPVAPGISNQRETRLNRFSLLDRKCLCSAEHHTKTELAASTPNGAAPDP